jgi:hypothetical protein
LKKFLVDEISGGVEGKKSKETLAVVDPKLGAYIFILLLGCSWIPALMVRPAS